MEATKLAAILESSKASQAYISGIKEQLSSVSQERKVRLSSAVERRVPYMLRGFACL